MILNIVVVGGLLLMFHNPIIEAIRFVISKVATPEQQASIEKVIAKVDPTLDEIQLLATNGGKAAAKKVAGYANQLRTFLMNRIKEDQEALAELDQAVKTDEK